MRTLTSRAGTARGDRRDRARSTWGRAGLSTTPVTGGAENAEEPVRWAPRLILLGMLVPVAFGRWGSYISPAGDLVFVSDLLVGAGLVVAALEALRERRFAGLRRERHLPWLAGVILVVCVIGLSRANSEVVLVIRDVVPILYLALIPVAAWAVRTLGAGTSFLWVRRALTIHTLWLVPVLAGVVPTLQVPFVGIPVFETRLDFDMLLCGAAIAAFALDHRAHPALRISMIAASSAGLLLAGSRAGLIGAFALVLVAFVVARPLRGSKAGQIVVGLVLIAMVPVFAALPALLAKPPAWAEVLTRLIPSDDPTYASALNTWEARLEAWRLLLDYARADTWRWLFGSGFGSSPVIDSGAIDHLSGDPSVRAAHSFVVTWIAFLGIVGATLLVGILVALFVRAVLNARQPSAPSALGLGLMTGTVLTAIAGVIFESPFGYQTFVVATALALLRREDLSGPGGLGDPGPVVHSHVQGQSRWRVAGDAYASGDGAGGVDRGHPWVGADDARERGRHE